MLKNLVRSFMEKLFLYKKNTLMLEKIIQKVYRVIFLLRLDKQQQKQLTGVFFVKTVHRKDMKELCQ